MKKTITYLEGINTLKAFLAGSDFETGEVLDETRLPNGKIMQAIDKLVNPSIDDLKMMLNKRCGYPSRRGFLWSDEEERNVISSFKSGYRYKDIAKEHQRSTTAIMQRLKEKGMISREVNLPDRKGLKPFSIYHS